MEEAKASENGILDVPGDAGASCTNRDAGSGKTAKSKRRKHKSLRANADQNKADIPSGSGVESVQGVSFAGSLIDHPRPVCVPQMSNLAHKNGKSKGTMAVASPATGRSNVKRDGRQRPRGNSSRKMCQSSSINAQGKFKPLPVFSPPLASDDVARPLSSNTTCEHEDLNAMPQPLMRTASSPTVVSPATSGHETVYVRMSSIDELARYFQSKGTIAASPNDFQGEQTHSGKSTFPFVYTQGQKNRSQSNAPFGHIHSHQHYQQHPTPRPQNDQSDRGSIHPAQRDNSGTNRHQSKQLESPPQEPSQTGGTISQRHQQEKRQNTQQNGRHSVDGPSEHMKKNATNNPAKPSAEEVQTKLGFLFPHLPTDLRRKLQFDAVSLYSTTDMNSAQAITELVQKLVPPEATIVDGTACIGGNVFSFAKAFRQVEAVELDRKRSAMLSANLQLLGIHNVRVWTGNYVHLMRKIGKADLVFLDPPWGGPGYVHQASISLTLSSVPLSKVCERIGLSRLARYIVIKVPRNFDHMGFFRDVSISNVKMMKLRKMDIIVLDYDEGEKRKAKKKDESTTASATPSYALAAKQPKCDTAIPGEMTSPRKEA